ncbi:malate dehydrogenase, mitochondrial-like [Cephus cinctus]|uniref:Malate dehydrogenase, mitochondrial n=1 Tax=Cephus cinctus TaxID=211228 RepID=A0AAJ7VXF7_CEPCN|nr:malate dehydrogenase, mitochondrial-like [Cephus cinctus]
MPNLTKTKGGTLLKQFCENSKGIRVARRYSSKINKCRVSIVGLGGVGKGLAHLLKMYPANITELRLCNRSDPEGMVQDLSHIPTNVRTLGFAGAETLSEGLRDANMVIVTTGVPRKGDNPREELFEHNANLCRDVISACAKNCPEALLAIVSNPVDSLVPLAAEVLKHHGAYCAGRLFGVCTLDLMRARYFFADAVGLRPEKVYVPVVGGHSEKTMVPLFSRSRPRLLLPRDQILELTQKLRLAGKGIVLAKNGEAGSTWSMASGAWYFVQRLCRAINHAPHVVATAYVESEVNNSRFFSNELLLGPDGVEENLGYGPVSDLEEQLIAEAIIHLQSSISRGKEFVAKFTDDPDEK